MDILGFVGNSWSGVSECNQKLDTASLKRVCGRSRVICMTRNNSNHHRQRANDNRKDSSAKQDPNHLFPSASIGSSSNGKQKKVIQNKSAAPLRSLHELTEKLAQMLHSQDSQQQQERHAFVSNSLTTHSPIQQTSEQTENVFNSQRTQTVSDELIKEPSSSASAASALNASILLGHSYDYFGAPFPHKEEPKLKQSVCRVAVILGKRLIRDQISVEYAKRIVSLVKQMKTGEFVPEVVCFTCAEKNGDGAESLVSEASVGYLYFRALCEEFKLNDHIESMRFYIDQMPNRMKCESRHYRESLKRIQQCVQAKLRAESDQRSCEYVIISSDYHLFNLQEIHKIIPSRSPFLGLSQPNSSMRFLFTFYPFCVSTQPQISFCGRVTVLASELNIVLIEINSVLDGRALFSQENLSRLNNLAAKLREMYRLSCGFNMDMRSHSEILEKAITSIRAIQTIVAPVVDGLESFDETRLKHAYRNLSRVTRQIRSEMDPDHPITNSIREDLLAEISCSMEATHSGLD